MRAGISRSWWALGLHLFTAAFAVGAFLWSMVQKVQTRAYLCGGTGHFDSLRLGCRAISVSCRTGYDHLLRFGTARHTLQLLLIALAAGVLVLFPSYYYLFRIFKSEAPMIAPSVNGIEEHYNKGPHAR